MMKAMLQEKLKEQNHIFTCEVAIPSPQEAKVSGVDNSFAAILCTSSAVMLLT
jgi:hypothetical protein